jgi:FAD/FMN-containing dehydrogenase
VQPAQHAVSGGYFNYMQADEPIERVRAAFGAEAFGRLRALKRRYDSDNVLRRNQNIPPAERTDQDAGGTEGRREAR